jgi:hypothetical protein
LLTYNYGFEGDLIKFFKVLVEEKKDIWIKVIKYNTQLSVLFYNPWLPAGIVE